MLPQPDTLPPLAGCFVLQDLTSITARGFQCKINPHQEEAYGATLEWFTKLGIYSYEKEKRFLSHRFDLYAGLSFPEADVNRLSTCIAFFLWAFSFDDLSDEGEFQSKPDRVQVGVDISMGVLRQPEAQAPAFKYAKMLHEIWRRFRSSGSASACNRFYRAVESWMKSQVEQAENRASNSIPSVHDFIVFRRRTIGGPIVEAMIEYSLDLQIPEYVWDHPVLIELSEAAIDIMTWPNDLCSFNKEQSDGDYQNLVFCVMLEHNTDLQGAIDTVTHMLSQRVCDYLHWKEQLPLFDPDTDAELAKYIRALEHYVQGTVVWYYESPRYFRGMDVSNKKDMVVPIFERAAAVTEPSNAMPFNFSYHYSFSSSFSQSKFHTILLTVPAIILSAFILMSYCVGW